MNRRYRIILLLALLISLLMTGGSQAAPVEVTLERSAFSGGAWHGEAGIYTLDGSIGQAVVGLSSAGETELCSGFWCRLGWEHLFLSSIQRGD